MKFNGLLSSRPVIDVPVDGGYDEVVVIASTETLRIDARSDLVTAGMDGGSIVIFATVVIDGLLGGMICIDMLLNLILLLWSLRRLIWSFS